LRALIEKLLKSGADPDTLSAPQGETVLMAAARVGNVEAVKTLLDNGAYADARENFRGQTALMWAAAEGHPDVIKLLVAKGANINARSSDRDTTPPKMEAGTPYAPIARGGLSALQFAARQGQIDAGKALLEGGADINQKDSDGNNALVVALLNSHYDFAQFLIDSKADPNVANKDGRTALYTAVEMHDADWSPLPARKVEEKTTSLEIIRSLLAHGAKVNAQLTAPSPIVKMAQDTGDRTLGAGATAFMRAARSADTEVMQMLLEKGADAKLANKDGLNALMVASGVSWADKIRGTEAQALEAVKLCAASGLDVNTATDKGDTALHGAANRGADSIVKYLAEQGATLDVKNKQGMTPLDLAMGKTPRTPEGGGSPRPAHESTVALLQQLLGTSTASAANKTEQQDQ
jgi:ankyrin repeat protein